MAAFFSFHLLFVVLKRTVKISVERNKRFHSLWVIGIIINVMVPTQPLEAVVSMHIIRHLLSVSYWHDRLQQLFWTFSHIKQNQQNYLRSPLEEALNLGFSYRFQFCVKLKTWWHLLNVFEDDPVTLDSIFPFSGSLLAPRKGPNLCCWSKAVLGCFHDYSHGWGKDAGTDARIEGNKYAPTFIHAQLKCCRLAWRTPPNTQSKDSYKMCSLPFPNSPATGTLGPLLRAL